MIGYRLDDADTGQALAFRRCQQREHVLYVVLNYLEHLARVRQ